MSSDVASEDVDFLGITGDEAENDCDEFNDFLETSVSLRIAEPEEPEESDVDFLSDDVASAAVASIVPACSDLHLEPLYIEPFMLDDVMDALNDDVDGVLAVLPQECGAGHRVAKPALTMLLEGARGQDRSIEQHVCLSQHMRFCKLQRRYARERSERMLAAREDARLLQSQVVRIGAKVQIKGRGSSLALVITNTSNHLRMAPEAWMGMAFDFQLCNTQTIGRIYKCMRQTVKSASAMVASLLMQVQKSVMSDILSYFERVGPMDIAIQSLSFDETSKTLLSPRMPGVVPQSVVYHILVSTQQICLGSLREGSDVCAFHMLDLLRPPVALTSTAAAALYHGLFFAKAVAHLHAGVLPGLCTSSFPCLHFSRDGASANKKLLAHVMRSCAAEHDSLLQTDLVCMLHSNDLIKRDLLKLVMPVVSGLYSLASSMKAGLSWIKVGEPQTDPDP